MKVAPRTRGRRTQTSKGNRGMLGEMGRQTLWGFESVAIIDIQCP
jgi:hypothetical protein